jgi:hypothetical protein
MKKLSPSAGKADDVDHFFPSSLPTAVSRGMKAVAPTASR